MIAYLHWGVMRTNGTQWRELEEMQAEAQRLAEAAGDEEEMWRIRVVDLFWLYWRDDVCAEEIARGREVSRAAADYFEAHARWLPTKPAGDFPSARHRVAGPRLLLYGVASRAGHITRDERPCRRVQLVGL